jgi:hypothetical protein
MAATVLTNVRLFVGGCDLTGQSNKVELGAEHEEKDSTTYASGGWKEVLAGIGSWEASASGHWQAGDSSMVDDAAWSGLGGLGPWSAVPVGGAAVGDLTYFSRALEASYKLLGEVGEIAPWEATGKGAWPLVRGVVGHPPGTARTSTGSGTGQQLGAVAAGQRLYAAVHVLSVSGSSTPTITLGVESDSDNTFASPTTRITFTAATAAGGQILRTDGTAITDTWFRPTWTISGSTPSFLFITTLGVR